MCVPLFPHADATSLSSKAGSGAPTHSGAAQGAANADGAALPLQYTERYYEPGCPRQKSRSDENAGTPQYDFAYDAAAQSARKGAFRRGATGDRELPCDPEGSVRQSP